MDRAEIVSLDEAIAGPIGRYERVLKIAETTPLEKGTSTKLYAAGVGMIGDDDLRLVRVGK